jgi:starch phosphorylase
MKNRLVRETRDVRRATQALATHLPSRLAPLAWIAYNYRWSWDPDGPRLFRDIDPLRWVRCQHNPVRFLQEVTDEALEKAANDASLVSRIEAFAEVLEADLARPPSADGIAPLQPIAFFCAEFGIHRSLPIYSGGLGVLAGDLLKEASDRALPMVGVGLLYQQGYFRQRLDASGWQHEYWIDTDPDLCPAVRVRGRDGHPLVVTVPLWGQVVSVHIWQVQVGRVPLFLLDAELPENSPLQRFVTDRLYEGNRQIRLAQYALLGIGGVKALQALGIDPVVFHLNEGHPATAAFELMRMEVAAGASFQEACAKVRQRLVFTTHTPVPAGNETYSADEIRTVFPDLAPQLGTDWDTLLGLGRICPNDRAEPAGMTVLAIRTSRCSNGVSRRHGEVARRMWQPLFPNCPVEDVPILHVTNGVHLPTWMAPPFRELLDRYLAPGWSETERVTDPRTWEAVDSIPDEELWATKQEATREMVERVRTHTVADRLRQGDPIDYAMRVVDAFDPNVLTLGFARRLATYKRLQLLTQDPDRFLRLLGGHRPVQFLLAGKAHPLEDEAKWILRRIFGLKSRPPLYDRLIFLEDYHMGTTRLLAGGCHVWVNLPRPPLEASGTSGMKAALNGALNLSVLDGWWREAYDGNNGWGIEGAQDADSSAQDARHASAFYDLLEQEIIPLFYERDAHGIPRGWVKRMKAALRTIAPRYCATRMLSDYLNNVYRVR